MKSIGFNNFRKFEKLEPIDLGDISFLVGPNNSGKSTIVKALLLIYSYLKSDNIEKFDFDSLSNNINIGTYGRAKHKNAGENFIRFHFKILYYEIELKLTANNDFSSKGNLLELNIFDSSLRFNYHLLPGLITISKMPEEIQRHKNYDVISEIETKLDLLKEQATNYEGKKGEKEYIELIDRIHGLNERRNKITYGFDEELDLKEDEREDELDLEVNESDVKDNFSLSFEYQRGSLQQVFVDFIDDKGIRYTKEMKLSQEGDRTGEDFDALRAFYHSKYLLEISYKKFLSLTNQSIHLYIKGNRTKQSGIFLISDRNNYVAQAIHQYFQLDLNASDTVSVFVKKWIEEFGLGQDIRINSLAGEAYEVDIYKDNNWIPLADNGMGTIQLIQLLLQLGGVIHTCELIRKSKNKPKASKNDLDLAINKIMTFLDSFPIEKRKEIVRKVNDRFDNDFLSINVILEEPELNLHPALQSKLADLFFECFSKYGIKFLIETHSEYLIRRTQLLVKEKELISEVSDNPFRVVYFKLDKDEAFQMIYRQDGKFENEFGKGFYDEAANLTLDLF